MDRTLRYFSMVVLLCVVPCLSIFFALVWTMLDLPSTVRNEGICLPSESGRLKCGSTADLLHEFLETQITKKYDDLKRENEKKQQDFLNENSARLKNIYDKSFWEMKPAAKLTGKNQPPLRKIDIGAEMVPIREWRHGKELYDTDYPNGFARFGVTYRNGRLVVPVDGTYFIYAKLDFFEECYPSSGKPNVKDINKPIKQAIFKFNILDGEERELVSNAQPHTVSANSYYNAYSSYVSLLAELKAGDELTVKISNITYLRYTRDNYFGVNLI